MDTHPAVRMLTAARAEALAVAVVDVAQNAADTGRELATRPDLDHLREVQRADLAALVEARLAWRFAGAMLAQTLPILGGVDAILRLRVDPD